MKFDFGKDGIKYLCGIIVGCLFLTFITLEIKSPTGISTNHCDGIFMIRAFPFLGSLIYALSPFVLVFGQRINLIKKYVRLYEVMVPFLSLLLIVMLYMKFNSTMGRPSRFIMIHKETSLGLGGLLLFVSYIGILFLNCKNYGYTFDKKGWEKFKQNFADSIS